MTVKNRRGFTKLEWQKMRERNEALDCRVYARAAAWVFGADRWPDSTWRSLEEQVGIEVGEPTAGTVPDIETTPTPEPTAGRPIARRRKRRAYTPKNMR
jgi:phage terminase large subunit GpA-like protein